MLTDRVVSTRFLEHGSFLRHLLASQRKSRLPFRSFQNPGCNILAERGAMLKPVPRASAHKPDVFHFRMPVDQEISIPSVFVLAYAGLDDGRAAQRRKSLFDKTPRLL